MGLPPFLRRLFGKPAITDPKWLGKVTYTAFVHPPRAKPRSWSEKFYRASRWSRPRVTVSQTTEIEWSPAVMKTLADCISAAEACRR